MGRLLKITAVTLGFALYVWIAAVGSLGRVRAAKRARRSTPRGSEALT